MTDRIKSFRDIVSAIERSDIVAPQLGIPRKRFIGDGHHAERAAADGRVINSKYHDQPNCQKKENRKAHARWLAMSAEQRAAHAARCRDGYHVPVDAYALAEQQRTAQAKATLVTQQEEWKRGER